MFEDLLDAINGEEQSNLDELCELYLHIDKAVAWETDFLEVIDESDHGVSLEL